MVLGRSVEGVEFDALDGKPTHLFFVLGLKYEELHLPWLFKLSQMLAREHAVEDLLKAPTPRLSTKHSFKRSGPWSRSSPARGGK